MTRFDDRAANHACARRVGLAAFLGSCLALSFSRFGGESTLPPTCAAPTAAFFNIEMQAGILYNHHTAL